MGNHSAVGGSGLDAGEFPSMAGVATGARGARGEGRLPLTWSSKALSSASKTRDAMGAADPQGDQRTMFAEGDPHFLWGWCQSMGEGMSGGWKGPTGSESQGQFLTKA